MSKAVATSSLPSSAPIGNEGVSKTSLRELRSSKAALAYSGVKTKATLAPSSTVVRRIKTKQEVSKNDELSTNGADKEASSAKGKLLFISKDCFPQSFFITLINGF